MKAAICGLLLTTLACLAPCGCHNDGQTQIGFEKRLPDPGQVKAHVIKDSQELAGYTPAGVDQELVAAFTGFNRMLTGKPPDPKTIETNIKALQQKAERALDDGGKHQMRKLCLWLLQRFTSDLEELIRVSAKSNGSAQELVSGHPPQGEVGRVFEKFAGSGGDFLRHAVSAGLITASKKGGLVPVKGAGFFVRLAFKVHFAQIFPDESRPVEWLLDDFERKWYYVWVVERSQTASMMRKLEAVEKLRRLDPGYADLTARGIVHFKNAKYRSALLDFQQALKKHPGDSRLKSFIAQAKQQAEKNPEKKKPQVH
jgi:tetratricopeptide (TPR) repeat protein